MTDVRFLLDCFSSSHLRLKKSRSLYMRQRFVYDCRCNFAGNMEPFAGVLIAWNTPRIRCTGIFYRCKSELDITVVIFVFVLVFFGTHITSWNFLFFVYHLKSVSFFSFFFSKLRVLSQRSIVRVQCYKIAEHSLIGLTSNIFLLKNVLESKELLKIRSERGGVSYTDARKKNFPNGVPSQKNISAHNDHQQWHTASRILLSSLRNESLTRPDIHGSSHLAVKV
jgi:hypothetical protein